MKTLISMVAFGNLPFTKLAIQSVKDTCHYEYDLFVVNGKNSDTDTTRYLQENNIPYIIHEENKGFPASVNDIYDYAWKENDYDYLIIMGNDVIAYPDSIDKLIETAFTTDYEAISTGEYSVKTLYEEHPEFRNLINPNHNYMLHNLNTPIWNVFSNPKEFHIDNGLIDIHNLALYKKSVFEKVGYIDVNFFPAYFEDDDYVRRMMLSNIKDGTINRFYFHFWSRTIHQGSGGSDNKFFENNRNFMLAKWGGLTHHWEYEKPFNGNVYTLTNGLDLPPDINIQSRHLEPHIIYYWKSRHG